MIRRTLALIALPLLLAACREGDPFVPGGEGRVSVQSDPPGARILLDGRNTGRRTPDTVPGLSRRHDVAVRLDTLGIAYGFLAQVVAAPDSLPEIYGPLVMRCGTEVCWEQHHRIHSPFRIRFATNPVGALFLRAGRGGGVFWPGNTSHSYVSGGMPVFAAVTDTRDTVALGVYDQRYLAGRPTPGTTMEGGRFDLTQSTWVLPPVDALTYRTARGIEVEQHVSADAAFEDVLVVRLVFRNISRRRAYQAVDPVIPSTGVAYDAAFVGFAIDPDIGGPANDWISYAPELGLVFAYGADFRETDFGGDARSAPGLVGLRILDAPPGTRVVLNGWAHGGISGTTDWRAGSTNERSGWGMLSGLQPYAPSHPDTRIGHMPPAPGDMRMSISAGPVRLHPGDQVEVTFALLMAAPVPGTFTSGSQVQPGDPRDDARTIARVAGSLFDLARATYVPRNP
jgi:hypothetical protein